MPDHFTVRPGPAVIVLHQEPHFTAKGTCACSCAACSRATGRSGLTIFEECICPGCPCTEEVPGA